ncbi:MAG TPA: penicillin-binding protein 2, partial [Bryobacteraceae bacterium]|nr:penicillin-binding protein 2 [Bryobacteraceae bacterium]
MQRPPGQPFPGDSPEPSVDEKAARRLQVLFRFAIGWALLIGLRLFHLQIVSHADYKKQANAQHERVLEIPAPRGAILDRDDRTLALSITLKSVVANPLLMPDLPVTAEVLARVLSLDGRELLHRMKTASATGSGFLWVKRKVTTEEAERVRLLKLTGVEFRDETSRMYPKGSLAAHVLGSVDHEDRGSAGIELGLQDELEGIPGALRMQKDVTNRGYGSQVDTKPQPGKNITLTIDERVQHIAERELMKAVEGCKCKTGSVVVMDPHNGDILAMASYPTYDPNELPKRGESLSARLNLAISAPFEPGSVFKVITLAAALETTSMGPESPVNCMNGAMPLAGRVIHEAKRGFGVLPMRTVLAKSSNIGAIQVGIKVGIKNLYAYIMRFGFGKRTGLPLPAEEPGRVFEPRKWGPQSIGSVPMGHEVTTTTIQLAQACAVVANDGLLVRPRIVLRRHRPGDPIEVEPVAQPARVLEARNAARMRDMMHDVVLQGGTGFPNAVVPGYDSAGKTGSAQIYDHASKVYTHKYNASFIGMAPLNNPRVVVAVTLNGSPLYGGTVAAPVFREVTGAALRILDVPKTAGEGMLLT